jgi:hypothetical protein
MSIILQLLNDSVIFPIFQISLLSLVLYAIWGQRRMKSDLVTVKRGEKSWNSFRLGFGITSVVLVQVINATDNLRGYKTFICIADLGSLIYLSFYNGWFRNATINLIIKLQGKEE